MDEFNNVTPEVAPVSEGEAAAVDTAPAPDLKTAKRTFSRLGWGAFAILAVASVLQGVVVVVTNLAAGAGDPPSWLMWVVTFAPLYCVAVPVGLLIMRKAPAYPAEPRAFGAGRFLKLLPICVFLMYAGNLVGVLVTTLLGTLKGGEVANPLESFALDDSSVLIKILVMAILAPLIEEFIFRKTLIDRMRPYGEKLAVVTSALMFGLFHGNLSQFFYAFALGVLFGYVYVWSGKLRYSAALHMLVNFFGSIVAPALLQNAGVDKLADLDTTTLLSDPEALQAAFTPGLLTFVIYSILIFLVGILGLVLLCINLGRMEYAPAERELPREKRFAVVWCNAGMIALVIGCIAMIVFSILS